MKNNCFKKFKKGLGYFSIKQKLEKYTVKVQTLLSINLIKKIIFVSH